MLNAKLRRIIVLQSYKKISIVRGASMGRTRDALC